MHGMSTAINRFGACTHIFGHLEMKCWIIWLHCRALEHVHFYSKKKNTKNQTNAEEIKNICDSASVRISHSMNEEKNSLRGIDLAQLWFGSSNIAANDLLIKYFKCAAIDAYTIAIYFTCTLRVAGTITSIQHTRHDHVVEHSQWITTTQLTVWTRTSTKRLYIFHSEMKTNKWIFMLHSVFQLSVQRWYSDYK